MTRGLYWSGLAFRQTTMFYALRLTSLVLATALALSACGNKGPLVLPDKTPEQQQQDKDKKKDQLANGAQPAQKTSVNGATTQH